MEPPAVEKEVGMEVYLTSAPGVGGKLRFYPEDFVVEELSLPPPRVQGGRYVAARVRCRNWETNRLVRELSRAMGISRRRIQFAGTKDKRGVKIQLLTFLASEEQVAAISLRDFEVLEKYPTDRPLELGHLVGNRFEIRLRGASGAGPGPAGEARPDLEAAIDSVTRELDAAGGFPNFFGIQRFGALRPVTHKIGERLVRGDIEGAVMAYVGGPGDSEEPGAQEARSRLERERDFAAAVNYFPPHLAFERSLIHHLQLHPGDWAGAMRQLPQNLLMMFVHAYQSCLFNRLLSRRIRAGLPLNEPVEGDVLLPADELGRPDHDHGISVESHNLARASRKVREGKAFVSGLLFGSETNFASGRPGELERAIVEEAGLEPQDFLVPDLPEVSSKGTRRELIVRPGERAISLEVDAAVFRFSLQRGCYATSLMREYMKGEVLDY
jgi:tRNA pseudouridine13 synthase